MTTLRPSALILFLAALAACGGDIERPDGPPPCIIDRGYAVAASLDAVRGYEVMLVNGFPVGRSPAYGIIASASPGAVVRVDAAVALVSGENTAGVAVVPAVMSPRGGTPTAGPARFRAWVCGPGGEVVAESAPAEADSAFARWERELAARWPAWRAAQDSLYRLRPELRAAADSALAARPGARGFGLGVALDSARAWAAAHPVAVEMSFVRPGGASPADGAPSFDAVFRDAPVIGGTARDSARLRAYGARLGALAAGRTAADGAAYYDEMAPAVTDGLLLAGRPAVPPDSMRTLWAGRAASGGLDDHGRYAAFDASDVRLRSWAGGRVWELFVEEGAGLLVSVDGDSYRTVFVGEVDGQLRVVRD